MLTNKELQNLQQSDAFCNNIIAMPQGNNLQSSHPFFTRDNILKWFVTDNKQTFETTVMSSGLTDHIMRQTHDELGHNSS